jgi:hypothetical protein
MAKSVVALMNTLGEAENAFRDLIGSCACDSMDISVVTQDPQGEMTGTKRDLEGTAAGALKGAGAGAAVGGIAGLLAGAAALAIPGLGPLIAAGPIAAALAGAGLGGVTGGIIGGLSAVGIPEDEAHAYAEGVRRGGTLIMVVTRTDDMADCAERVMRRHGAVDIGQRTVEWKREGWSGRVSSEAML